MSNIIKISLLMVLALAFLTACQESNKMTAPEVYAPELNETLQIVDVKGAVSGDQVNLTGWAENLAEPGHIFVANDPHNLYVSYYLSDNWQLAEANLNISKSRQDIPTDEQGNPLPEKFRYKATLSQCETVYTYVIPLAELGLSPGDDFYLASQALVGKNNPLDHISQPYNICVPGKADQEWWQIGRGLVKTNTNAPDRLLKLSLQDLPGYSKQL